MDCLLVLVLLLDEWNVRLFDNGESLKPLPQQFKEIAFKYIFCFFFKKKIMIITIILTIDFSRMSLRFSLLLPCPATISLFSNVLIAIAFSRQLSFLTTFATQLGLLTRRSFSFSTSAIFFARKSKLVYHLMT